MTTSRAFAFLTLALALSSARADDPPAYKLSRQDEDWSPLRDPALRTDSLDTLKFIPLTHDGLSWITLGGEIRERYEYFDNANWGKGPQDSNGYLLQRFLLSADAHASEYLRLFTEFQSGLEDGRNGGPRPTDRDVFDLHQLFIDARAPLDSENSLTLRLGRQELAFGTQRLISLRDSPNLRRTFDGARAIQLWNGWQFDEFAVRPVRLKTDAFDDDPDPATKFWGFYGVAPFSPVPGGKVDFYYLGLNRASATYAQGTAKEERHSVGVRLWGKRSGWDWNHEFVYQFGTFGSGDISAWTAATDIGYKFANAFWSPRLGLKADVTSGDGNPKNGDLQTFNPLFPRGAYFAETGLIGPQNHIDSHPSLELHPLERLTITTDLDFFWRESIHDGVYNISQTLVRSGTAGGARYIGSQATGQIEWRLQRHVTWIANYAHFFAGAFLNENPPSKDVNYFSSWISFRF